MGERVGLDLRKPRHAFGAATVACAVLLAAMLAVTNGDARYFEPRLYTALETTAALGGLAAAYLVFFRFRRSGRLDDLLLAFALGILGGSNLFYGAIPAALDNVGSHFFSWGLASGTVFGALMLAAAVFAPTRALVDPRRAAFVVTAYSVVGLAMFAEAATALAAIYPINPGERYAHTAALAVQLSLVVLFAATAVAFIRRGERLGDGLLTWIGVAAALRVFAGIDFAFHPSLETGWVYMGDFFRMLFYFALLAGAASEVGRYWRASREAAVLDERQRIARDLHDGLAQELAFIVRRAKRLLDHGSHSRDAVQIADAANRAVDESRRVIATLTRPLDEPLDIVLSEAVKGVADRVGTTVALALDSGVHVSPDVREALVRIAREAVSNAVRHGEAELVRVELEAENGTGLRLRIVDDGRGFDATAPRPRRRGGGFGLVSMAERARAIGGVLHVASERGAGTTVEVELL